MPRLALGTPRWRHPPSTLKRLDRSTSGLGQPPPHVRDVSARRSRPGLAESPATRTSAIGGVFFNATCWRGSYLRRLLKGGNQPGKSPQRNDPFRHWAKLFARARPFICELCDMDRLLARQMVSSVLHGRCQNRVRGHSGATRGSTCTGARGWMMRNLKSRRRAWLISILDQPSRWRSLWPT